MDSGVFMWLALGTFLLASFCSGITGFGMGILAMTILTGGAGMHPADASVLATIGGFGPTFLMSSTLYRNVRWQEARLLILGICVGVPAGVWVLATADPGWVKRAMGLFVVAFSLWSYFRGALHTRAGGVRGPLGFGILSGLLGGAFCAPGPTLVAYVYSRDWRRDELKSTLNVCFLATVLFRLVSLHFEGLYTVELVRMGFACLAASAGGALLGLWAVRFVPVARFKQMTWIVFGMLGVLLLVRG